VQIRRTLTTVAASAAALVMTAAAGVLVVAPAAVAAPCPPGTSASPSPTPTPSETATQAPAACNPISVTVSDVPTSVGLAGDWNTFDVAVTNHGESREYYDEQNTGFFLTLTGNSALASDNLDLQVRQNGSEGWWESFELREAGSSVEASAEVPGDASLEAGETKNYTVRFRVGENTTAGSIEDLDLSPLKTLSIDVRLATADEEYDENDNYYFTEEELIGSDDLAVAVKTLKIEVPAAIKPVVGTPIVITTTTKNLTGSDYADTLTIPMSILGQELEGGGAPLTARKATKQLKKLADATQTTIEFREPGGAWMSMDENCECPDIPPFGVSELPNGQSFTTEWRFTFNDANLLGVDKAITWASLTLNFNNSQPDLRRSVRGGRSGSLLADPIYLVGLANTALGIAPATVPATTPPVAESSPAAEDKGKDKDEKNDDSGKGEDESGGVAPTGLADTGADSNQYVAIALMLLIAGGATLIASRRRVGSHQ
jgi:LPXTG-motif cell wall-anchored protein